MDMEALVQKITEEVMKQLKKRQITEKLQSSKKALILSYRDKASKQDINQLETMGVKCIFLEEYIEDEIKNIDYIILSTLPLASLAYIAMGIDGDEVSKITIKGMLHGKEIVILTEGMEHLNFEKTSNPNFYKMYKDYENKLQSFGVKIGHLKEVFSISHKDLKQAQAKISIKEDEKTDETFIENKLITEKLLKEMDYKEDSTLCITAKAIITPMAKDYIRIKKIEVIRV